MNKTTGIRGTLIKFPFQDLRETIFNEDGIEIEISNGEISVGVDDIRKIEKAKEIAQLRVAAWNHRHNWNASIDFNARWSKGKNGENMVGLDLGGSVPLIGRRNLEVTTSLRDIRGKSSIINQAMIDTASFNNDDEMLRKSLKNNVLKTALLHFAEEVVDSERPLYGIYKSIEAMTKHLGKNGREKLAKLASKDAGYAQELMETTQTVRHSPGAAPGNPTAKLEEKECRLRARILIKAFADSLV